MESVSYDNFRFEIEAECSHGKARTGRLHTPHGVIETPNFFFCGTKAAVRSATPTELRAQGVQTVLSNTYHLMLRPGPEIVEQMGGLHRFMGWDGPMFTDSGGYQIFCMGQGSVSDEIKRKGKPRTDSSVLSITEEGVEFRSYVDGGKVFLTPERSVSVQRALGADLITVLDECTPYHVDKDYTRASMEMSHRWGKRSLDEFIRHHDGKQALYGIMQGGVYADLRRESGTFVSDHAFFGNAVGGSLGQSKAQLYDTVGVSMSMLRLERPTHLLGVGQTEDIFETVGFGIDTYDCVSPTRVARHGWALTRSGNVNLLNAKHKLDDAPIEEDCACSTCAKVSRGYLNYLFKAGEDLGGILVSVHNIAYMMRLMAEIREGIRQDNLDEVKARYRDGFSQDPESSL